MTIAKHTVIIQGATGSGKSLDLIELQRRFFAQPSAQISYDEPIEFSMKDIDSKKAR